MVNKITLLPSSSNVNYFWILHSVAGHREPANAEAWDAGGMVLHAVLSLFTRLALLYKIPRMQYSAPRHLRSPTDCTIEGQTHLLKE